MSVNSYRDEAKKTIFKAELHEKNNLY